MSNALKFVPASYNGLSVAEVVARGFPEKEAEIVVADLKKAKVHKSSTYQVCVWQRGDLIEMSIKRLDRRPIGDWRIKQAIKNAILGEEVEAVELYPAESRLVDTANQYYLWALPPGQQWPFGFSERLVSGAEEASRVGAVQRDFGG